MGVENFKRWQWAMIGLLIGAAIGGSQVFWRDGDPGGDRTFDRQQFEGNLRHGMAVRKLVLHPPVDGQQWVTGEAYKLQGGFFRSPILRQRGQAVSTTQPAQWAKGDWVTFPLLASEEHSQRSRYDTPASATDYLAELQKRFPKVDLTAKFAWWEEPRITLAIYSLSGLVLLGGIWPNIVSVLTGGPLFGKRPKDPNEYDLDRFGQEPEPEAAPAAAVPTDPDALIDYNAALQEKVGDFALTPTDDPDDSMAPAAAGSGPIKSLNTGARVSDPTAPKTENDKSDDPRDYGGEFYPVAKPGGKPKN